MRSQTEGGADEILDYGQSAVLGWNDVFPDPGMTVAAIDRLVHHSTIFEFNVESYRRPPLATNRKSVAVNYPPTIRAERQP
jgi:hypothetical protein